jgi:hypothetical protein
MTTYAGQKLHGEIEVLPGEHPDPSLLFDNKTAREVHGVMESSPFVIPFDLYRHLHAVREANDSHLADYYINALHTRANEIGKTVLSCIDGLPAGIMDEFVYEAEVYAASHIAARTKD